MIQQDLFLEVGGDFVLTNTGDLQLTSPNNSWDYVRQFLERFIFTSAATLDRFGNPIPPDWLNYPNFGLGANQMVGQAFGAQFISALQQKVYQGALAAQQGNSTVPPVVTVTQGSNPQQINVSIVITPLGGQQQSINVTLP